MTTTSKMADMSYIHNADPEPLLYTTIPDLLDLRAREIPTTEAFVLRNPTGRGNERAAITFRALRDGSTKLALHFLDKGFLSGDRVILTGPVCLEWFYVKYALMKIGAVPLRMDVKLVVGASLSRVVHKHKVKAVIHHPDVSIQSSPRFSDFSDITTNADNCVIEHVISMTSLDDVIFSSKELSASEEDKVQSIQSSIQPDQPVYVFFTSGSSGFPKAVARSHVSFINELVRFPGRILKQQSRTGNPSRVYNDRSPAFVGCISSLSVICGVTMVYVDNRYTVQDRNMDFVFQVLHEERITYMRLTPSSLQDLIEVIQAGCYSLPAQLDSAMTGADAIQPLLFRSSLDHLPGLQDNYGSTESGFALVTSSDDPIPLKIKYSGLPLGHCEVKIVDDNGAVVKRGDIGELHIRSPYVFLYYIDDEEATFKAKDPYSGWFKTGDIAQMTCDGHVAILGRRMHAIFCAESEVYPIAVEKELTDFDKVGKCVVVGVPGVNGYEDVCACVIPMTGKSVEISELREFCDTTLKERGGKRYVPKHILIMESFPTLMQSKIDRKKLRDIALENLGLK